MHTERLPHSDYHLNAGSSHVNYPKTERTSPLSIRARRLAPMARWGHGGDEAACVKSGQPLRSTKRSCQPSHRRPHQDDKAATSSACSALGVKTSMGAVAREKATRVFAVTHITTHTYQTTRPKRRVCSQNTKYTYRVVPLPHSLPLLVALTP